MMLLPYGLNESKSIRALYSSNTLHFVAVILLCSPFSSPIFQTLLLIGSETQGLASLLPSSIPGSWVVGFVVAAILVLFPEEGLRGWFC